MDEIKDASKSLNELEVYILDGNLQRNECNHSEENMEVVLHKQRLPEGMKLVGLNSFDNEFSVELLCLQEVK